MDLMAAKVRGVYEHPAKSGVWWIQYFENGRRRRERVGTRSNAIKLYQKRKTQILVGEKLPELQRKKVTLGELLDDVLEFTADHKSARDYHVKAELVRQDLGGRIAESITTGDISAWVRRRGVSNGTWNRYRAFFSLCYKQAILAKKLRENPAKDMVRKKESRGRIRFLSREVKQSQTSEYGTMVQAMTEEYADRVEEFEFSVYSGARLGEQFRLDWPNVHFERDSFVLRDTKNGEDREVPMNSVTRRVLENRARRKKTLRGRVFGSLHRFCCKNLAEGKQVQQTGNSPKWFRDLAASRGIRDYTWHCNRHTFCSWLAMAGTPLKTIGELAGHRSITMTARYAHLSPDHKRHEIERMVPQERPQLVRRDAQG